MIHVIKLEILADLPEGQETLPILNNVIDTVVNSITQPITGIVAYIGKDVEDDDAE